ncbi:NADP-dependent oxidoreductase [Streptomyces albidus (ex Kaewkla and Franco 2022)]|uniref:NADP-dependent oxidoreductase n=1 Tax=Streptomyces albidus (ex Kaewkla and Franco 2022) TaxID=722709 RepID=UPI0015EE6DB4|nr:NADP-dependent oxidoreductase [Streptomyces albidus (ex Kaewkla and Franco 2022)]
MKAIALEKYGTADDLNLVELPEPKVAPGEVLVRVKAAGVNPVDWKLGAGGLDPFMEAGFPMIPGWDVAGVVERTGFDAGEFAPGDEVYGYVRKDWAQNGTYAELVSAPVRTLAKKPASLSWTEAAGVPLAGLTAYQALKRVAAGAGDTVLIHAAAGGVGSFGVQIAVALGARVIGTASERNHGFLRSLGAEPVTYGDGLADRVRQLAPQGVDAALDFVGAGAVDVSLSLVERADRVASVAEGEVSEKGGHYVWVRPDASDLASLAQLADAGKLTVHVDQALPLAETAQAWRLSQAGRTRGKIVLTV